MFKRCKTMIILLCGLLLVSCRSLGTQVVDSAGESGSAREKANKVYTIVTKEKTNSYMGKMAEGFKRACEEMGVEVQCLGPADYSAESQIKIIEDLIESKVDVIAISANNADALEQTLQKAINQGIIIVSLDSAVNSNSRMLHIQQTDPETVGRVLMQAAASMIDYKGTIGVISTTEYVTNQNLWMEWLKKEAGDNEEKYRDIVLLPEVYGEDNYDISADKTLYLIKEYPQLDIIITPSAVSMRAVGDTLHYQNSDIIFTGLGLPSEMAEFVQNDLSCRWFYLWNPIELGYLAAYSASALDDRVITGEIGDVFAAGSLGQRVVTRSGDGGTEVILGDPLKFDAENIDLWKTVY